MFRPRGLCHVNMSFFGMYFAGGLTPLWNPNFMLDSLIFTCHVNDALHVNICLMRLLTFKYDGQKPLKEHWYASLVNLY